MSDSRRGRQKKCVQVKLRDSFGLRCRWFVVMGVHFYRRALDWGFVYFQTCARLELCLIYNHAPDWIWVFVLNMFASRLGLYLFYKHALHVNCPYFTNIRWTQLCQFHKHALDWSCVYCTHMHYTGPAPISQICTTLELCLFHKHAQLTRGPPGDAGLSTPQNTS